MTKETITKTRMAFSKIKRELWLNLAEIVDEEMYDKIWLIAVTKGSDHVIDYLIFEAKRADIVRYWHRSGLSSIYDFDLENNPFCG